MNRHYLWLQRDRIQRQVDYAKEVNERNRKAGQQTSGKSSRRTSYLDEEKETALNRRKQVLVWQMCLLLFPWRFQSRRVAGVTADLPSPHRPVRLLTHSQSNTFQVSLTCVFPLCLRSSSLPFPWYIRSQHFPQ